MHPTDDPTVIAGVAAAGSAACSGTKARPDTASSRSLTRPSFADPAVTDGRYHRVGGPGVRYASDQEQAAWAELFRHFLQDGVDPFEVRRRTGNVTVVDLDVLDLTDPAVRRHLNLEEANLDGDTYTTTQHLAAHKTSRRASSSRAHQFRRSSNWRRRRAPLAATATASSNRRHAGGAGSTRPLFGAGHRTSTGSQPG